MTEPQHPWRALQSRNLKLFFTGQSISVVGSFMTQTGRSWLIYSLTSSAAWLGAIMFAEQFSTFILLPIAGVLADSSYLAPK